MSNNDPLLHYAERAFERIQSGEYSLHRFEPGKPRRTIDRRAALGGIAHGVLCRREWCDASGGSSSTAYEPGHRDWVEGIDAVVEQLEGLGVGLRTPEFHSLLAPDGDSEVVDADLPYEEAATRLGVALHRAWCSDPTLLPGACGRAHKPDPCLAAFVAAEKVMSQFELTGLEFIDLTRARLMPRTSA